MNVTQWFWDHSSRNYDGMEKDVEQIRDTTLEQTKKYLRGGEVLLDYGCGTGTLAIELAGSVRAIQAIDISPKMIAVAKQKAAERNLTNIDFRQATLFDTRLEPESCDVVLATGILHLIKQPRQAVQRIHELLKPGGWFISATPCIGSEATAATVINRLLYLPGRLGMLPFLRFLKVADLEQTITQGGFHIVEQKSLTFGRQSDGRYVIARLVVAHN